MKIIFLGTPEFAVPSLKALINSNHDVVAVVSQPAKPKGRGKKIVPTPVEKVAIENNIPTHSFKKIRTDGVEVLKQVDADIMVMCAYGQILSKEILEMKKYGVVNIHGSVLPKYRGASPIQETIINGDKTGGITILKSDVGIDDGKIILTYETEILKNETSLELFDRLSVAGAEQILKALELIETNKATYEEQNHELATFCTKLTQQLSDVDFSLDAKTLVNLINGISYWPVAKVTISQKPVKIFKASVVEHEKLMPLGIENFSKYKNGEVVFSSSKQGLIVKVSDGFIEFLQLQAENSKKLGVKDFLNGKKIEVGTVINE